MIAQRSTIVVLLSIASTLVWTCGDPPGPQPPLTLVTAFMGTYQLSITNPLANTGALADQPVVLSFSHAVDVALIGSALILKNKATNESVPLTLAFFDENKTVRATPAEVLQNNTSYLLLISETLKGTRGEKFSPLTLEFKTSPGELKLIGLLIDGVSVLNPNRITNVPVDQTTIELTFNAPVAPATVTASSLLVKKNELSVPLTFQLSEENKKLTVTVNGKLMDLSRYRLEVSEDLAGGNGEVFDGYVRFFYTGVDPDPDFPVISDDALLTLVQQQTFKYFWDFAHPASGMARERNTSGDLVTSGGSGFGIMAIIVGIERDFITRAQGLERMDRILDFLESADRFHGAWPHWINGNTGDVIPFSANDNGGDLVETSFLVQGLLTFRQYLNESVPEEIVLIGRINALWQSVEWDWYTRGGQNVLYWHWSPDKEWTMNHQVKGYNEALITYVLAASSPGHSIDASAYHEGWASNGGIENGEAFYGISLPVGFDFGGPLFFAHYSFLGLDPRNLSDGYADYWTQNVNHSLINHAHSIENPRNYVGYSDANWGLTASDNHEGYSAHSPTNDLGVITPTAALSSFAYTPVESTKALKFFYYTLGDRLWGEYGFYDAFNLTEGWVADSYLAIDQGPIIVMIENYRTGLLWDLFMSAPEVQNGLDKLSFTY